jgi:hypothetical protein
MPVNDGAMGDRDGGEGATATGGDRRGERRTRRGGGDAVVGGVASAVDDNGEDDGGGRWHHATTNPVMATMSTMVAVAYNDGVGGQQRR